MSEPKKPELPSAPSFFRDPNASLNTNRLTQIGQGLTSGDFADPSSSLGFLAQLVQSNPQVVQQAVQLASRGTIETRDNAQRDILNQLEANNQLTSSTAVNRLADLNQSFSQDIADINTKFALADAERSLANTFNLFGLGLDVTQSAGSLGLQNQQQQNAFNLDNFSNQFALAQANQKSGRGGLIGGLAGTAIGIGLAPFTGGSSLMLAGLGGALGSGIGEAIAPSQTGNVAAGFGTSALGMIGQQATLDSQASFLDKILSSRGNVGTGSVPTTV